MMALGFRRLDVQWFWRAFALVLASGLVALGCGGGGSPGPEQGGGPTPGGVPLEDEGFDTIFEAKRIIVDGPPVRGAINPKAGGDTDWYTFHGVLGMTYVLQIFGYETPQPGLTGDSISDLQNTLDLLRVKIVRPDGATQLGNSSGSDGGFEYDIDLTFFPQGELPEDSRIVWVSPFEGDFFLRIQHHESVTSIGNYVFKLASVHNFLVNGRVKDGVRDFRMRFDANGNFVGGGLFDDSDPPDLKFDGIASGTTGPAHLRIFINPDGSTGVIFQLPANPGFVTFLSDGELDDEPQSRVAHIHFGVPNNVFPERSRNQQPPDSIDDPHPFVFDLSEVNVLRAASDGRVHTDVLLPGPDGEPIRVPITSLMQEVTTAGGDRYVQGNIQIHTEVMRGSLNLEPDAEIIRLVTGWDWYFDAHFTDDLDLVPEPVAVSPRNGGMYGVFETAMPMSGGNVVLRAGEEPPAIEGFERGTAPPFDVFYDASLQAFQIAVRTYSAFTAFGFQSPASSDTSLFRAGIIPTGAESFFGLPVKVHRGGPGEIGPAFIDLGTIPDPGDPVQFDPEPGFRAVIKQLSDIEAELLRDQFYNGGFYIEVTSPTAPLGLLRAEGFINIQRFPLDETVRQASRESLDTGTVNFASEYGNGGSITVTVNGDTIGVLSEYIRAGDIPECGSFHTGVSLASERIPAKYPYKAVAEDGTEWAGQVEITAGSCETIVLSVE